MLTLEELDKIAINVRSHKILRQILKENPILEDLLRNSKSETEVLEGVKSWVMNSLYSSPIALKYYLGQLTNERVLPKLNRKDIAAIRILDYIEYAGIEVKDLNLHGEKAISNPIVLLWMAATHGTGGAKPYFFEDMLHLFRQFRGKDTRSPVTKERLEEWMDKYPTGLDPRIIKLREENRKRIIHVIIDKIDSGQKRDPKYKFTKEMTREEKFQKVSEWWHDRLFHLRFAVRKADDLNEMLGYSLDPDTMKVLYDAESAGIPFFVNPYYLSLLYVRIPYFAIGADLAMRDYVLYSRQLVSEFGQIAAWEKEDTVISGQPNAAGWLLPEHNIHRRYPEVAILIPDTVGRACGGLCSACQRMYGFQAGELNFNLEKLKPKQSWKEKLTGLMDYFLTDSQLRDILITGGDALMSSDSSIKQILEAVYEMAVQKRAQNQHRPEGEKYAEIVRIRLGTKLPTYLPQRFTPSIIKILAEFKAKASQIGIRQFVIQTHFQSPLEITPESRDAVQALLSAGWIVTNQVVFTTAASRRGHTAKLRQILNEIGVISYYTFSVKGYMENYHHFATNARLVQEQLEEKVFGTIPECHFDRLKQVPEDAENVVQKLAELREDANIPFLATDRSVLNLPGVGKSLTFRVIGITRYGRRILKFEHDTTRVHSPIIEEIGSVIIVESKSVSEYLNQLKEMGEDLENYECLYGYSIGETEERIPIYDYPDYDYTVTQEFTNLKLAN